MVVGPAGRAQRTLSTPRLPPEHGSLLLGDHFRARESTDRGDRKPAIGAL
jgi:hypothetical protein